MHQFLSHSGSRRSLACAGAKTLKNQSWRVCETRRDNHNGHSRRTRRRVSKTHHDPQSLPVATQAKVLRLPKKRFSPSWRRQMPLLVSWAWIKTTQSAVCELYLRYRLQPIARVGTATPTHRCCWPSIAILSQQFILLRCRALARK